MSPLLLAILMIFVSGLESKHLPSYIVACKKSDPNLNDCAKQHANDALSHILKGQKSYKIPNYLPFQIPLVDVQGNTGLKFQLKDLKIIGLESTKIQEVNFDLAKKHFYVKVLIAKSQTVGNYLVDGKVLSLVMKGEGPVEISYENLVVEYFVDYDLITKPDGKQYIDVDSLKTQLVTNPGKLHYNFGNLFGGNKLLGDNFNNLLNENPKDVQEISGEADKVIINSLVFSIFNALFKVVPYDEIFLD